MGVHVDTSEVLALEVDLGSSINRVGGPAAAALRKTAHDVESDAKVFAPKDTGNLANSISTDIEGDGRFGEMSATVGPTADYGAYVEYGTSPHVIRAKGGGKLAFRGRDGGMVFVDEVHHPGSAPQPFMGPAFDRRAPLLEQAVAQIAERGFL